MLATYDDIRSRIKEEPKWFDSNGVPRYCDFAPEHTPDIYINEAVLFKIKCQSCAKPFNVAITEGFSRNRETLKQKISEATLSYGDPPRHDDCLAGDTMCSITVSVTEYWAREDGDWIRYPDLERDEFPELVD